MFVQNVFIGNTNLFNLLNLFFIRAYALNIMSILNKIRLALQLAILLLRRIKKSCDLLIELLKRVLNKKN